MKVAGSLAGGATRFLGGLAGVAVGLAGGLADVSLGLLYSFLDLAANPTNGFADLFPGLPQVFANFARFPVRARRAGEKCRDEQNWSSHGFTLLTGYVRQAA
jgi:hypothetical protein